MGIKCNVYKKKKKNSRNSNDRSRYDDRPPRNSNEDRPRYDDRSRYENRPRRGRDDVV